MTVEQLVSAVPDIGVIVESNPPTGVEWSYCKADRAVKWVSCAYSSNEVRPRESSRIPEAMEKDIFENRRHLGYSFETALLAEIGAMAFHMTYRHDQYSRFEQSFLSHPTEQRGSGACVVGFDLGASLHTAFAVIMGYNSEG